MDGRRITFHTKLYDIISNPYSNIRQSISISIYNAYFIGYNAQYMWFEAKDCRTRGCSYDQHMTVKTNTRQLRSHKGRSNDLLMFSKNDSYDQRNQN